MTDILWVEVIIYDGLLCLKYLALLIQRVLWIFSWVVVSNSHFALEKVE